jgi:hypothetical protein
VTAARAFLEGGFRPGDVLPNEWLYENLGLPGQLARLTWGQWRAVRDLFRARRRWFVLHLLRRHQLAFDVLGPRLEGDKVWAGGLRLVGRLHPLQRLFRDLRKFRRWTLRSLNETAQVPGCVRREDLSAEVGAELLGGIADDLGDG